MQSYQLLLVESSMRDALLIVAELECAGLKVEFERVETAAYMGMALDSKAWDFIICDAQLPDFGWFDALAIYKGNGLDIPFIMVSNSSDEDLAIERIMAGVHEHVLKDSLARLPAVVERELRSAHKRRIRNQQLEELERLDLIQELMPPDPHVRSKRPNVWRARDSGFT
jgi:DNA-binding NtrC family response regulator